MVDTSVQAGDFILPGGEKVYSGLRATFVKMEGLLAYLAGEKFSGYLRLHVEPGDERGLPGLMLFKEGAVIEAIYGESRGVDAQDRIGERIAYRAGNLDIIGLDANMIGALASSFGEQTPYTDLHTFFVDLDKLVIYLSSKGFSGSVSVDGKEGRGVVLLDAGRLVGAYTGAKPDVESHLDTVKVIGADGEGMIRVSGVAQI